MKPQDPTIAARHVDAARTRKMAEAHAIGIDDAFISELVERFYENVRLDDQLGPNFAMGVKDWPVHLSRMKNFWGSIMIESGRFSGSPMQKHIAIGGLDAGHFARWQSLWDQTVTQLAPNPEVRDRFRQAARRIGESLLTGIELDRGGLAAVTVRNAS
ncbi:MAG: group III truncated hemoglobin [Novosphingobium sp.]